MNGHVCPYKMTSFVSVPAYSAVGPEFISGHLVPDYLTHVICKNILWQILSVVLITNTRFTDSEVLFRVKKAHGVKVVETPFNTKHWESLKKAQLVHGVAVENH